MGVTIRYAPSSTVSVGEKYQVIIFPCTAVVLWSNFLLPHRVMIQNYRNGSFEGRPVLGQHTSPKTGRVVYTPTYSLFYAAQYMKP